MAAAWPERTRVYRHHHLDSTHWDLYRHRAGDVIISTSIKAGTNWMQRIMSLLVFGAERLPASLFHLSPWIDCRFTEPIEVKIDRIEAQQHQRFLKSHLPLDALPYHPDVRYVFVARDTRDVFMSLWDHYTAYNEFFYERLASASDDGARFPRPPADIRDLWRPWITRGWFEWEHDGWPFWSHHYHAASFWPHRHLPNVLVVHYNDLLSDLDAEMRRVADFAGVAVDAERWPALVAAARFEEMKADAGALVPETALGFEGGPARFVNQGTNGRWRGVLTDDDLALYDAAADASLSPDLRAWLEGGRISLGPRSQVR